MIFNWYLIQIYHHYIQQWKSQVGMHLVILYGSQTGTAQDVAEQIWRESKCYGFTGPVLPMDELPIQKFVEARLMVLVASTTGNGDEPDNMKQTWKFLLRKSLATNSLQHLHFACLGLGDSSYTKFNFAAKKLHKRLLQLGGSSILPLGLCDDQHDYGLRAVALPWMKQLWTELQHKFPGDIREMKLTKAILKWNVCVVEEIKERVSEEMLQWPLREKCQRFILKENKRITHSDHFQDVRLLRFAIPEDVQWEPGDIFCVRPCNSREQVNTFFALVQEHCLPFNADTVVQLSTAFEDLPLPLAYSMPVSVGQLAKYIWDFSAIPRQRAFELLAMNCDNELEKEKLLEFTTAEGLDDLIQYINRPRRNILEVLQDFRHATAKLSLDLLFEIFSIIQPRSFSIASSIPEPMGSETLDLLVAVVEYKTKLSTPRLGLCSNWLKSLEAGSTVFGTIRRGSMTLPRQASTPLIMVGPGTGIAPFRSIIQQKWWQRKTGQAVGILVVYFGCRNKEKDFHFRDDFEQWESVMLTQNFLAFSRDQENKIYVQHLIKNNKDALYQLIKEKRAVILVAGSSKDMPKAVKEAFISVLNEDVDYVEQMIKTKRYQEETWS